MTDDLTLMPEAARNEYARMRELAYSWAKGGDPLHVWASSGLYTTGLSEHILWLCADLPAGSTDEQQLIDLADYLSLMVWFWGRRNFVFPSDARFRAV